MKQNSFEHIEGVKICVAPGDGWIYTAIVTKYMNGENPCHQFMIKGGDQPTGCLVQGFVSDDQAQRIESFVYTKTKKEWHDSYILNYTLGKVDNEMTLKYWDVDYLVAMAFVICAGLVLADKVDVFELVKEFRLSWFDLQDWSCKDKQEVYNTGKEA